jgi:hypothetical protein
MQNHLLLALNIEPSLTLRNKTKIMNKQSYIVAKKKIMLFLK